MLLKDGDSPIMVQVPYGKGTVIAALPFIPTIPGTDTYTDKLWVD